MSPRRWFWRLLRRNGEIEEEIRSHFELAVRERVKAGEDPREAEFAVRREFGNVELVREVTRDMWGWRVLERVGQDVRHAARALRASPGFTLTALLSLMLGIGANSASFSVSEALLLRPLPIQDPAGVVKILGQHQRTGYEDISYPDFLEVRERARSFSEVTAFATRRFAVARQVDAVPRMVFGMIVSQGFFETIGVTPVMGRGFSEGETSVRGRDPVAVVSHEFWRDSLGADAGALGATLRVNGIPFTVIGVAPEKFTGMSNLLRYAIYVPATMADRLSMRPDGVSLLEDRGQPVFDVRGRLKPGVTLEEANAEVATLGAALTRAYPDTNRERAFSARSDFQNRVKDSPELVALTGMLMALSLLVLVIACANVASLLLARARVRIREMAIRTAIGAGRGRLFQQLLTESVLLAVAGGVLGVGAAYAAIRYLAAIRLPTDTPMSLTTQLDGRVLAFSLAVSVLSALFFGAIPAWRSVRMNLTPALKSGEMDAEGRVRSVGRSLLVGAQVALCLVLLVASAAMLDAFRKMLVMDPGIRTDGLTMLEFDPSMARYTETQAAEFYRQLTERVRALPGVRSAALSRAIPFRPNFFPVEVIPEGYVFPAGQDSVKLEANVVDEDYFATAGVPVARGRQFTREDRRDTSPVVIVNEEFARRYFPAGEAVGRRVRLGGMGPSAEVVGVARTARYVALMEAPTPYLYLPYEQAPQTRMTLLVATHGAPSEITGAAFDAVRSLDANMPVFNVYDMRTYYQQGVLAPARVVLQMVGATGVVGLTLAIVGLYGLVAYTVSRRTREIGIRLAVGADREKIVRLVLRQGLALGLAGTAAGLALSVPVFQVLAAGLSGLGALSPWILVVVPAGLTALTIAASYVPASRASRIDPVNALRME
jgi:macrolide transport system ATP-binding/permease protein